MEGAFRSLPILIAALAAGAALAAAPAQPSDFERRDRTRPGADDHG
jgi:hypothetical protein